MLNMQNVKDIEITEGNVRTIHDKNNRLLWGRVAYDTKYAGDSLQDGTPTPDAPIPVQVVTGEQTVTVSDGVDSEDFTISLGSIELCKIGTYQDYIYNSGNDWYVHKACGKIILNGSETWNRTSFTVMTDYKEMYSPVLDNVAYFNNVNAVCNNFSNVGYNLTPSVSFSGECFSLSPNQQSDTNKLRFAVLSSRATDSNIFKTWLSEHNTTIYYALATATDTKITDATLLGQLNAVHGWLTRYGYNATVTGNLPIIINQTNL